VPNNQIYLHAKFCIFLRYLSISPNLFHPCLEIKLENELKKENLHGSFPSAPSCRLPPLCSAEAPLAVTAPPSMPRAKGSVTSRAALPMRVRHRACHLASLLAPFSSAVPCVGARPFSMPQGHLAALPLPVQHGQQLRDKVSST
jgi:hypothetical protein